MNREVLIMNLINLDIDQLLEDTSSYNGGEDLFCTMIEVEIDGVLAATKEW
jgi:hypothetical protein